MLFAILMPVSFATWSALLNSFVVEMAGDIAPTAAVTFTINHIATVFLLAVLDYIWLSSRVTVFIVAASLA
ncbi:MAG: hypothetical protein WA873_13145, partial [Jannaschia helgolandensis]